jgi:hypothetical protein
VSLTEESRPPLPPYDLETALQKVQAAEDAWNTERRLFGPRPAGERGSGVDIPLR